MTQADKIRQKVCDEVVGPALSAGSANVVVRSGDVHSAMHLNSAMPAVCSALLANTKMGILGYVATHVGGPNPSSTTLISIARVRTEQRKISWKERLAAVR